MDGDKGRSVRRAGETFVRTIRDLANLGIAFDHRNAHGGLIARCGMTLGDLMLWDSNASPTQRP